MRYCRKNKGDRKSRGRNSRQKKYIARLTWKARISTLVAAISLPEKCVSHQRNRKDYKTVSRRDRNSDPEGFSGESSALLLEHPDQLSDRSDSGSGDDKRLQKEGHNRLRVFCTLNELFAGAADYHEYEWVSYKTGYRNLSEHVPRFRKKTDVPMRPQVLRGRSSIAVLDFLKKSKIACILKRIPESIAVWFFKSYVKEPAESLGPTMITGSSVAMDSKRSKMLCTYGYVGSFSLQTYAAADAFTAKTYFDVVDFRQSSTMTEDTYYQML